MSIVAVVWHHSYQGGLRDAFPMLRYGFLGVDLFFAISGFLIVTLLLRERDRTGGVSLRHFYARRSLRIFPLYYGVLAAFSLAYFVLRPNGSGAAAFRSELPQLSFYLTNWIPASGMLAITWSLSAEEQFYLVWPTVEKWLTRGAVYVVAAAIVASQIIQLGLMDPSLERAFGWDPTQPSMLRETTFTPILFGVVLAHALHHQRSFAWVYAVVGRRFVAPLLLVLLLLVCSALPDDIRGPARLYVHVTQLLLLASVVVREDHALAPLLQWRPLVKIGVLSYGIYLLHQPALAVTRYGLEAFGMPYPSLLFVVGFALAVLCAALSYRFYERRFLRLKRYFA